MAPLSRTKESGYRSNNIFIADQRIVGSDRKIRALLPSWSTLLMVDVEVTVCAIGPYSHIVCLQQPLVAVMPVIIDMLTAFAPFTTAMEKQFLVQHISITEKQTRICTCRKATTTRKQRQAKEVKKGLKFQVRSLSTH